MGIVANARRRKTRKRDPAEREGAQHTNNSAVFPVKVGFVGDIPPFIGFAGAEIVGGGCDSEASRKGFLDSGGSEGRGGEGRPFETGDTARLRKGLFEEKFSVKPGEGWRSRIEQTSMLALTGVNGVAAGVATM